MPEYWPFRGIFDRRPLTENTPSSKVSFRQACVTDLARVDTVELCPTERLAGNRGQLWMFLQR